MKVWESLFSTMASPVLTDDSEWVKLSSRWFNWQSDVQKVEEYKDFIWSAYVLEIPRWGGTVVVIGGPSGIRTPVKDI